MLSCWSNDPTERPTFSELAGSLSRNLSSVAGYMDLGTINTFGTWEGNDDPVALPATCDDFTPTLESAEVIEEPNDGEISGNTEDTTDVPTSCNDQNRPLITPVLCTSATPSVGVGEEVIVNVEAMEGVMSEDESAL